MLADIRHMKFLEILESGWVKVIGSDTNPKFHGQLFHTERLCYYDRYGDYSHPLGKTWR